MTIATEKKITKSTFKSFINKNREKLLVAKLSSFDGMIDCVTETGSKEFCQAKSAGSEAYTLGVAGVWLVSGSRNWFSRYETETHVGFEWSNCCGSGIVAIAK